MPPSHRGRTAGAVTAALAVAGAVALVVVLLRATSLGGSDVQPASAARPATSPAGGGSPGQTASPSPSPAVDAPGSAPASQTVSPARSGSPYQPLARRSWRGIRYPLACGPVPVQVLQRVFGELDGDGRPDAVAVVSCAAGAGSPPQVLVGVDGNSPPGAPRLLGRLQPPPGIEHVTDVAVGGGGVTATGLGYSTRSQPRCCPDRRVALSWR